MRQLLKMILVIIYLLLEGEWCLVTGVRLAQEFRLFFFSTIFVDFHHKPCGKDMYQMNLLCICHIIFHSSVRYGGPGEPPSSELITIIR